MAALLEEHKTYQRAADAIGVPYVTFWMLVKKLEEGKDMKSPPPTKADWSAQPYSSVPHKVLAQQLGVSVNTVREWANVYHAPKPFPRPGFNHKPRST